MSWQFSFVNAEHGVDEDQFEPGIADADQARTHIIDIVLSDFSFNARLGLSPRVGIELLLPLRVVDVSPTFRDEGGADIADYQSIHHRDETIVGLADLMLRHRYRLLLPEAPTGMTLDLLAGLTFPTGDTEPNPFAAGRRGDSHQHMFFGSGTISPLAGVEGDYAFEDWSLLGWASLRAPVFENNFGYRGPTQVSGGVGARSGFGLADWRFLLQPELYHETPAQWSGEDAENSGRTDLIAAAGVFWAPTADLSTHLLVKAPFTLRSKGGQLRMPIVLGAGASYAFGLWGEP